MSELKDINELYLKNIDDEDLVDMICGIATDDFVYITIGQVKEEILLRLNRGDK